MAESIVLEVAGSTPAFGFRAQSGKGAIWIAETLARFDSADARLFYFFERRRHGYKGKGVEPDLVAGGEG